MMISQVKLPRMPNRGILVTMYKVSFGISLYFYEVDY